MHFERSAARPLCELDDDWLLQTIATSMARVDPRSIDGAPVLVADLRPQLERHFRGMADFVAALLRLEQSDRLTLIRRDPAFPAIGAEEITSVRDGRVEVIGVALR